MSIGRIVPAVHALAIVGGEGGCLYGGLSLLASLRAGLLLVVARVRALAGVQLGALAIVGQYVYRALDEARGRPRSAIETVAGRLVSAQPAVE